MEKNFLSRTPLFHGITQEEAEAMLDCLGAERKSFRKGGVIFRAGEVTHAMGLVVSGSVQIENDDIWGDHTIMDRVMPGFVFAETYACIPDEPMMVSVTAAEETEVLFLNVCRMMESCPNSCPFHRTLQKNLLRISAQKNLTLSRRMFHISPKTIRGRLLSYLSDQAAREGAGEFDIPFNRQQLADYLGVDRSALSNELGKMQRDGLIRVRKNHFQLLKQAELLP